MEGGEETDTELGDFERMSIVSSESDDDAAVKYAGGEEPREELRTTRPDLSAYASQTPMHEGMVFKIGGRKGPRRILKRYFVLYPGVILYYHHRTSYARDKKRGLTSGKFISLDGVYLSKPESAPSRIKFCVILHTPHEANKHKELLLAFHHKKDKNMWIELLQTQNAELMPSPSEETGSKKRLPLYIQKMRKIDYYNPRSRYHMSRFHSLPNTHRSISKEELESLKALYPSSSSLPVGTGYFHDTIVLHHDDNHTRLGATDSTSETTMSCISEVEELGSREVEDSDEATSDEGTESGHKC